MTLNEFYDELARAGFVITITQHYGTDTRIRVKKNGYHVDKWTRSRDMWSDEMIERLICTMISELEDKIKEKSMMNATTFLDPATKTLLDRLGAKPKSVIPPIEKVVFNDPATIVFWADKTKTVVKAGPNDIFDPEKGLAMAIAKKALGNQGNYYNTIKKWLPEEEDISEYMSLEEFTKKLQGITEKIRAISKAWSGDATCPE